MKRKQLTRLCLSFIVAVSLVSYHSIFRLLPPTISNEPNHTSRNHTKTVLYIHVGKTGSTVLKGLNALSKAQKLFLHEFHVNAFKSPWNNLTPIDHPDGGSTCLLYPCILLPSPSCAGAAVAQQHNTSSSSSIIPSHYDLIVLWVRDPLARFISIWQAGKSAETKSCRINSTNCLGNLNDQLTQYWKKTFTTKKTFANQFLEYLQDQSPVQPVLHHMRMDLPWYMGSINPLTNQNCTSLLLDQVLAVEQKNKLFVGRTEYTDEDCEQLGHDLPHSVSCKRDWSHHYKSEGENLSAENVRHLKQAFLPDYVCLQNLVDHGYLDQDYVSESRYNKVYQF